MSCVSLNQRWKQKLIPDSSSRSDTLKSDKMKYVKKEIGKASLGRITLESVSFSEVFREEKESSLREDKRHQSDKQPGKNNQAKVAPESFDETTDWSKHLGQSKFTIICRK